MCGIAGIIGKPNQKALERMLQVTKHRGPNNTGYYTDEDVSIGMNRLSIIDVSDSGNQPIISNDGRYIIVYNGEIYNFKTLRNELISDGVHFNSNTDTEVLLNLYIKYGIDCLSKIRGMFSFVIWDKIEQQAFGARDHLGIKPFLYSTSNHSLLFCSEMKGILASQLLPSKQINFESLSQYYKIGHCLSPNTFIKDVYSLQAGNFFTYKNNELTIKEYWTTSTIEPNTDKNLTYSEITSNVRSLVLKSVEEELMSDVPLGIFMGSGLDSSVVTAAMKLCGSKNINSFTIGFEGQGLAMDESPYASEIAKYYATNHHNINMDNKFIEDSFNDFVTAIDQPSKDGFNTYLVSKFSSQYIKVALSGLGGDELFCGYKGFKSLLNRNSKFYYNGLPKINNSSLFSSLPLQYYNKIEKEQSKFNDTDYFFNLQSNNSYKYAGVLSEKSNNPPDFINFVANNYSFSKSEINRYRQHYMYLFMSNLLLRDSDVVAMRSSLEVRFPLIDIRIVEYALTIPEDKLIQDRNSNPDSRNYLQDDLKRVLRDAFIDDLPQTMLNRNKQGFSIPHRMWMDTVLNDKINDLFNNPCELFDKKELKKVSSLWKSDKKSWHLYWTLMILDQWYKINLD